MLVCISWRNWFCDIMMVVSYRAFVTSWRYPPRFRENGFQKWCFNMLCASGSSEFTKPFRLKNFARRHHFTIWISQPLPFAKSQKVLRKQQTLSSKLGFALLNAPYYLIITRYIKYQSLNFSPCKPLWKYIIRISAAWGWAERQDQFQASSCRWVVRHFKFPDSSCPKLKGLWNILYLRWAFTTFTCKCSALSRMPREFNIVQSPKRRCRRILTLPYYYYSPLYWIYNTSISNTAKREHHDQVRVILLHLVLSQDERDPNLRFDTLRLWMILPSERCLTMLVVTSKSKKRSRYASLSVVVRIRYFYQFSSQKNRKKTTNNPRFIALTSSDSRKSTLKRQEARIVYRFRGIDCS